MRLQNEENKNMLQLRRDNQQQLFSYKNKFDIAEIQLQESVIEATTIQQIKEIKAFKD